MSSRPQKISSALRWLEILLHIFVPCGAAIAVLLSTLFPGLLSNNTILQLILALIAGLAISETLLRYRTLSEVQSNLTKIGDVSIPNLEILKSANEAGVVGLAPRASPDWLEKLVEEVKRAEGGIDICGVALPALHAEQSLRKAIMRHAEKADVRVLLLDPISTEAKRRAELERPLERRTVADIEDTIEWIQQQQKAGRRFRVHLYSLPPMLSLFITNMHAYVEPYHFGRPEDLDGCIGGHVPMMKLRNTPEKQLRNSYLYFREHFEYMWKETYAQRVTLSISVTKVLRPGLIGLRNETGSEIAMGGWELSARGSAGRFRFDPDFRWRKDQEIELVSPSHAVDGSAECLWDTEFLGENTILTLTNERGVVVAQWPITTPTSSNSSA